MALIVIFDELATPQKVLEVLPSANTPDYDSRSDVLVNPDLSGVAGVPQSYWKHDAGAVVEFTQAEKDAQDAAGAAAAETAMRDEGAGSFNGQTPAGQAFRALVKVLLSELNILRAQHGLPARTLAQAKGAIQNAIANGDVDE